ncbi:LLM class flavin-dependent oxidoreductase [Roseococcus suduntuyensis]|uniref:FMN-dependent oxidoreductase (Nitrilotriacetate monooxygenase family) n=1 Tax=Roseococcus suduntuyensis TaxID=455361 RepID=A0A840AIL4_9PROT|nr:LLM class flavin-dependent oxidoreductase [Roseococcus suduntuyensis]MBB3900386.1 FMN-dependent oxidoreductase (nitrilotriacetate monooxygenase family) [Roseococcus suduntuyensis]
MTARRMHLVAYLKTGPTANHPGAWRHPAAALDDIFDPGRYEHIARVLEAARFDGCFYADTFGLQDIHGGNFDATLRHGGQISYLDPMMVLPLMARATRHLGLGATLSTSFAHPYALARSLASLDHLSGGRAAWNVVTSATDLEARNFGMDGIPAKGERYDRADEALEACCALWDGWEEGALVKDRAAGVFVDPSRVHYTNYEGRFVRTRGPLSIPRSPQGRPVLMQAGSSERGREFAARWAEIIFVTPHQREDAVAFRQDMHARLVAAGRRPEDCKILPSFALVLAETDSIAREKHDHLQSLITPDAQMMLNSALVGVDLTRHQTAREVAQAQGNQGIAGSTDRVLAQARAEGLGFAEAAAKPRGLLVGSAATVADMLEEWFSTEACDGFIFWPTVFPSMFEDVARLLVPELQRRGLFRRDYAGATLRQNLASP